MENIQKLITEINRLEDCEVFPKAGMPIISNTKHKLPRDLEEFYSLCGGAVFYDSATYAITLVPPEQFVPANPVIIGEQVEDDRTADWYIIGECGDSNYLTIDLASARLGLCYDSFWETHGLVGDTRIIAESFTDLIKRLIANQGDCWYWLQEDFDSLGDAYDL